MKVFIPFRGFTPDLDPTEPGSLVSCSNISPTVRGIESVKGPVDFGAATLAAACTGAATLRNLSNTARTWAGTATKLYEFNSSLTWDDRSRSVGGNYSLTSDDRWRFAIYGNVHLATNKQDTLQATSATLFADVSGAPSASIVATINDFVFLFDTNEGTYGDSPDRWWCSALGDYTDWAPAIATQCATGRLTSIPGKIRGGQRLGEQMVVYKDRGIYVGTYTGPALIWDWAEIPGDVGAVNNEVIINVGTEHYFMAHDGFFRFDGVTVRAIDGPVRNWWINRVEASFLSLSLALHDRFLGLIYWYYAPAGSQAPTEGLIYNYRTGAWGVVTQTVEATVTYEDATGTWDSLGSAYSTFDDLPNVSYDTALFSPNAPVPALFDSSHDFYTLTGSVSSWSLTTGDFGDGQEFSFLTRVVPRFYMQPSGAQLVNHYRNNLGDSLTTDRTATLNYGRFNMLRSARWHRATISGAGGMELLGVDVLFEKDGME